MSGPEVDTLPLPEFELWNQSEPKQRDLFSIILEITARCNNNCRHCYINLPASEETAKSRELSFEKIRAIADEAASMGALWCLITGGEPLLRPDFEKIYRYLKQNGFLVSVFTNATLIDSRHVRLFAKYPPRTLEITVYGTTRKTYERVTRRSGSFSAFHRGLFRLLESGINVNLKAMAIQSNKDDLPSIEAFCRKHSKDPFRFDTELHLRFDGDVVRNIEIIQERLTPAEAVALEVKDGERFEAMKKTCMALTEQETEKDTAALFRCGAALNECVVGWDGRLRACSSLWHPDFMYDLRTGSLEKGWHGFMPKVRKEVARDSRFLKECSTCGIVDLCMNCPAHAHLETGRLAAAVDHFCKTAHLRKASVNKQP